MAITYNLYGESNYKLKNKRLITSWIRSTVQSESSAKVGDISVVFCSDAELLKINNEYLNHNYYTDIITFDYCDEKYISGDLMISVDTVASNATEFGSTPTDEMNRVIIHGVLHLLGYKDKSDEDAAQMRAKENQYLAALATLSE